MLQDYLYEVDSTSAAQLVTIIGGLASLIHYVFPKGSAMNWGISARSPIVFWIVERTGFINCLMALACLLTFFYNVDDSDAMKFVFTIWACDSLYQAFFRPIFIAGSNHVMYRTKYVVYFFLLTSPILLHFILPEDYVWGERVMKTALHYALFQGFLQTVFPPYALFLHGFPCDDRGYSEALFRIYGGSLMQFAAFGLSAMNGVEGKKALYRGMMCQLAQMFFSRFVLHDAVKLGLDGNAFDFWILLYLPAICSLWLSASNTSFM